MSRRKRLERTPNGAPIREKLLVQAMELLANDGFDRFNVQRVLDGAGVSRATLYRHFPDVDGLIEAAMVEIFRQQIDLNLRAARELVELSTDKEMFRDGIGRLLEALSKTPAQVRILRAHTVVLGTSRPEYAGASGVTLLKETYVLISSAGYSISHVSVQIIGNRPRIGARRAEAISTLSQALGGAEVAILATTTDGMGLTGEGKGIAAIASALVIKR